MIKKTKTDTKEKGLKIRLKKKFDFVIEGKVLLKKKTNIDKLTQEVATFKKKISSLSKTYNRFYLLQSIKNEDILISSHGYTKNKLGAIVSSLSKTIIVKTKEMVKKEKILKKESIDETEKLLLKSQSFGKLRHLKKTTIAVSQNGLIIVGVLLDSETNTVTKVVSLLHEKDTFKLIHTVAKLVNKHHNKMLEKYSSLDIPANFFSAMAEAVRARPFHPRISKNDGLRAMAFPMPLPKPLKINMDQFISTRGLTDG